MDALTEEANYSVAHFYKVSIETDLYEPLIQSKTNLEVRYFFLDIAATESFLISKNEVKQIQLDLDFASWQVQTFNLDSPFL